jgi:hypothetical protein
MAPTSDPITWGQLSDVPANEASVEDLRHRPVAGQFEADGSLSRKVPGWVGAAAATCGSLLVRRTVDTFAQQVSMPVVLGILLDHVHDHCAHRHDACPRRDGVVV